MTTEEKPKICPFRVSPHTSVVYCERKQCMAWRVNTIYPEDSYCKLIDWED